MDLIAKAKISGVPSRFRMGGGVREGGVKSHVHSKGYLLRCGKGASVPHLPLDGDYFVSAQTLWT